MPIANDFSSQSTSEAVGSMPDDPLPRSSTPPQGPCAGACEVTILDPARLLNQSQHDWLSEKTAQALRTIDAQGEVRVRLVSDAEMADAHQRHMGASGTTDVITFNLAEDNEDSLSVRLDTDLLLCVDEARRQSERRAISLERELLLYTIHGTLHCLGHDDHTDDDARAMHAREDEILESIGVGATFTNQHDATENSTA